jgi:hypothetical protein
MVTEIETEAVAETRTEKEIERGTGIETGIEIGIEKEIETMGKKAGTAVTDLTEIVNVNVNEGGTMIETP